MKLSTKTLPGIAPTKAAAFPRPAFATPGRIVTSQPVGSSSSSRLLWGSTVCRGRRTVLTHFKPEDEKAREVGQAAEGPTVSHPTLFTLKQHCAYGQQWKVCGSCPELGNWDPGAALPMAWGPGDQWFAIVDLPEGQHIEYKHVLYDEHTDKCFWVHDGMTTNMALEVIPNARVFFGPSTAVVGGPDAPDVRQMEDKLEKKRADAMCTVELHRVAEGTPAVESIPFGKTVEQEFTEAPLESREVGPRGPVGPFMPPNQPEEGYKPPTDVPASVEAVPPGGGGVPPTESFREQVQAAKEAAGLTEAARDQGVVPDEPTAQELAGATAAAEPTLPEQMEHAHAAGAASPASGAMISDASAMTPRTTPNAAASLFGHTPGPQPPHGFVPKIELVDPAEERALAAQIHMDHEVDVAASSVQQLVRHAGRIAEKAAQEMGLPEGMAAEKSRDASRKVADAAMDAAGGFGEFANGNLNYEAEDAPAAAERAQEAARAAMSAAADAAQAAAKKAHSAALQAQEGTTETAQSAAAVAASAAERAQGAAEAALHAGTDAAKGTAYAAKELAGEAAQEVKGAAEQVQGTAEAAVHTGKDMAKDTARLTGEVAGEAKDWAKKLGSKAGETLADLPPDMDVAGDPSSAAVARQLEQEDSGSFVDGSTHTLGDAISSAAHNLQAMHKSMEENLQGGADSQQQRPGSPLRGSAPAPNASKTPSLASNSNTSVTSGPPEGDMPKSSSSGEPPSENVINWVSENTPEEKQKIENLREEALWTPGGLGGQLGTESTQEDRDSWMPRIVGEGSYSPSVAQGSEPQLSSQRGASGFTQRNDADVGRDQPSHYPPSPREGMGSTMAAQGKGPEGEEDPDADGSARLRSMSRKDREQDIFTDYMQPRTPEGAEKKFESVAEAAQSSKYIPKPSREAAEAAARREEEESPTDPSQPLFNPRLSMMTRAQRDALEQEARQQASQIVPEEYEAGAEAGGGTPQPAGGGQSRKDRGDVLEEPQGLPHIPSVGEEASVQDVE